jgi:four helix bundle protein
MLNFERLIVWQKAIRYAVKLVRITDRLQQKYQFSFGEQLRRAALSIPSNIAEGAGRKTKRDRGNFYSIAKGSVYESVNILKVLESLEVLSDSTPNYKELYEEAEEVCKMLFGLDK